MEQRSEAWFNYRRDKIGASEAAPLLGLSPYSNPHKVWLSKQKGFIDKDNPAMRRGRELEPEALRLFESETGYLMSPKVMTSEDRPYLMASFDGFEIDGKCAVEIKCGGEKLHLDSMYGKIPDYYIAQMQHQMYVGRLHEIYYCSYRPTHVKQIYIEIVKRDEDFIQNMIEVERKFYEEHMLTGIPPGNDRHVVRMDSVEWADLAYQYIESKNMISFEEARIEEIKERLVQISKEENASGNGITLQKVEKKGIIDYKNIPILKTMDLEPYRKPGTIYWQIKEE